MGAAEASPRSNGGTGHPPSLNRPAAVWPLRTAEMRLPFLIRLNGCPRTDVYLRG
jgi:hypothetical protein